MNLNALFSPARLSAAAVLGVAAASVATLVTMVVTYALDPFGTHRGLAVDDVQVMESLVMGGTILWMVTFVVVGAFAYGQIDAEPTR